MTKITIKTKNGVIHSFEVDRGDDFLSTLDKFLKKNTIVIADFISISVDCQGQDDSVSCRVVKAAVEAIDLES